MPDEILNPFVRKIYDEMGVQITNCFLLRPLNDPAVISALISYAGQVKDKEEANIIYTNILEIVKQTILDNIKDENIDD